MTEVKNEVVPLSSVQDSPHLGFSVQVWVSDFRNDINKECHRYGRMAKSLETISYEEQLTEQEIFSQEKRSHCGVLAGWRGRIKWVMMLHLNIHY